jgi:large subunit ribosomal protein L21
MTEQNKYAIIETGGKQYRVSPGQRILVEKLAGTVGDAVSISTVLLIGGDGTAIGSPYVDGAAVQARIVGLKKDKKVRTFKKRIKTGYAKTQGHRQQKTELLIESISVQ